MTVSNGVVTGTLNSALIDKPYIFTHLQFCCFLFILSWLILFSSYTLQTALLSSLPTFQGHLIEGVEKSSPLQPSRKKHQRLAAAELTASHLQLDPSPEKQHLEARLQENFYKLPQAVYCLVPPWFYPSALQFCLAFVPLVPSSAAFHTSSSSVAVHIINSLRKLH